MIHALTQAVARARGWFAAAVALALVASAVNFAGDFFGEGQSGGNSWPVDTLEDSGALPLDLYASLVEGKLWLGSPGKQEESEQEPTGDVPEGPPARDYTLVGIARKGDAAYAYLLVDGARFTSVSPGNALENGDRVTGIGDNKVTIRSDALDETITLRLYERHETNGHETNGRETNGRDG